MKAQNGILLHWAITALAFLLLAAPAVDAFSAVPSYLPYPSANSLIINPYGEHDESALLLAAVQASYQSQTRRSITIKSMLGRGGADAWSALSESAGDGYTLALTNLQSLILRSMASRPVFKLEDIFNTNIIAEAPLVLWVPAESPFPNITELLRSANAHPNKMIIAGAGSNAQPHLASLRLNFLAGIKTLYLPYMGTSTSMQACKMGQAHAAWGFSTPELGRELGMRPLAVASRERHPKLLDVPTFDEVNIGLFEAAYFGLAVPVSTQPGTRQSVSAQFNNVSANPDFQARIIELGFIPRVMPLQEVSNTVQSETGRLTELLEQFDME